MTNANYSLIVADRLWASDPGLFNGVDQHVGLHQPGSTDPPRWRGCRANNMSSRVVNYDQFYSPIHRGYHCDPTPAASCPIAADLLRETALESVTGRVYISIAWSELMNENVCRNGLYTRVYIIVCFPGLLTWHLPYDMNYMQHARLCF